MNEIFSWHTAGTARVGLYPHILQRQKLCFVFYIEIISYILEISLLPSTR